MKTIEKLKSIKRRREDTSGEQSQLAIELPEPTERERAIGATVQAILGIEDPGAERKTTERILPGGLLRVTKRVVTAPVALEPEKVKPGGYFDCAQLDVTTREYYPFKSDHLPVHWRREPARGLKPVAEESTYHIKLMNGFGDPLNPDEAVHDYRWYIAPTEITTDGSGRIIEKLTPGASVDSFERYAGLLREAAELRLSETQKEGQALASPPEIPIAA